MFGGELTDQSLQKMVGDYQDIGAAGVDRELEKTDMHIINSWLGTLYPELLDTGSYKTMMNYVELEKLTGFYERRQNIIEDFLENNGQNGDEKEYLLQINAKVKEPFRYEWTEGWSNLLGSIVPDMGVVMALFLAIVLSSLFAGEWYNNTSSLLLTTKMMEMKSFAKHRCRFVLYGRIFCNSNRRKPCVTVFSFGHCRMGYADPDNQTDCHCTYEYATGRNL